jgi:hypothetical protein
MGLPNGLTGKCSGGVSDKYTDWRRVYENIKGEYNSNGRWNEDSLSNHIRGLIETENVLSLDENNKLPSMWVNIIWNYAVNGIDETNKITVNGKKWIDKHLCPYPMWNERRSSGKFCKYNLTDENIELLHVGMFDKVTRTGTEGESGVFNDIPVMLLTNIFSQKSLRYSKIAYGACPDDDRVFSKPPINYVTITYSSGTLKIVVLDEEIKTNEVDSEHIFPDTGNISNAGVTINLSYPTNYGIYWTITQTKAEEYPLIWRYVLYTLSKYKLKEWLVNNWKENVTDSEMEAEISRCNTLWNGTSEDSINVIRFAKDFYTNVKKAMPLLLSHRYQTEILGQYTNSLGKSLVDYSDDNTILAKALPIMDVSKMKDVF